MEPTNTPQNLQNPSDSGEKREAASERMDYGKMDTESLNRMVVDRINRLVQEGWVNDHFLRLRSLKEDSGPSFFLELILVFLADAHTVINDMLNNMYGEEDVDYIKLHSHSIKLKGSSACFGALRITTACSHLNLAIQRDSKKGCRQALNSIRGEYDSLNDQLDGVIKIEREIVSRVTGKQ